MPTRTDVRAPAPCPRRSRLLRLESCSSEIRLGLAVFGVALLQPGVEFRVVLRALLATVAERVVTEIQQPPPLRRAVGRGTVRRVAAEDGHVAGRELEN